MNVSRGTNTYDVVIVGTGHAGCEAALASARLGCRTAAVTISLEKIAAMPCNPSIGGMGKSQIVREIDALGGEMGRAADAAAIHFKMLGSSKGPAVRARRVQCDYLHYHRYMRETLEQCKGLDVIQGEVTEVLVDGEGVCGVRLSEGKDLFARQVVLTTGTFLRGISHVGMESFPCGRLGDRPAYSLSESLERLGISLGRLKTGTPPRLAEDSIDGGKLQRQPTEKEPIFFSLETKRRLLPDVDCLLTRTNENTHKIIVGSLDRSPLYSGKIKGRGPRYCPSIEDKVVKFPERKEHNVILEPTGVASGVVYPNGISTSLPKDTQEKMVHSIFGLENAQIISYGYAIEYDFVRTRQLAPTLECRKLPGLFLAGQVNGTSGYEEAAGQGLLAGINAARRCRGLQEIIIPRSLAYIGVMIDDLVNYDVSEPYRMFTSRAEFRLLLREDNAWARLEPLAEQVGLLEKSLAEDRKRKEQEIERVRKILCSKLGPPEKDGRRLTLEMLLRRPQFTATDVEKWVGEPLEKGILDRLEVDIKYKGYIERQLAEARRLKEAESKTIPVDINYRTIPGLSSELVGKLESTRPPSLAAASRIEGMTPAAMMILAIWISRNRVPRETLGQAGKNRPG